MHFSPSYISTHNAEIKELVKTFLDEHGYFSEVETGDGNESRNNSLDGMEMKKDVCSTEIKLEAEVRELAFGLGGVCREREGVGEGCW